MNKIEKTKHVFTVGIIGYILGILIPSALIGSAISMIGGIILLCSFIYYCKLRADEYDEE